jgi:hypothetical protein
MTDKLPVLVFYALAGLLVCLWPTIIFYLRGITVTRHDLKTIILRGITVARHDLKTIIACLLIIGFGLIGLGAAATPALFGAFVLISVIATFYQSRFISAYSLAVLAGLVIAATLPWWRRDPGPALNLSWIELSVFAVIATVTLWVLKTGGNNLEPSTRSRGISVIQIGTFVAVAAILSFTTGIFHNGGMLVTAWHHWGAYIGPSELLLAGARLFNDFPAQYGFGPTVLIASVCGKSCWGGMYFIVGFTTLLFALLIATIALGNNKQGLPQRGLILLLVIVCCFFWTSYPPKFSSPMITPSVSGLRFLPVLALVAMLLWIDRRENNQPYPAILGHMAWAAAALWSIESAFYATFVWWPYYLFLRAANANDNRERTFCLLRALGTLLALLVVLVLCFQAGYWFVYQTTPSIYGYVAYALNPPGPMPINAKGAVWFFLAVITLGTVANWHTFRQSGNSPAFRRGFLLLLLAYSTFSYFLGRSHDNNILNLLPFLLLVLLNVRATPIPDSWRGGFAAALLACLLGWISVFGWGDWRATLESGKTLEFNPAGFRQALSYGNPDTAASLSSRSLKYKKIDTGPWHANEPEDAARAISEIHQNYGEPVTVLDPGLLLTSTDLGSAWSAIHGPANFTSVPSASRREFMQKTANTLKRSGWLVVARGYSANDWLADFDSVYTRTQEVDFGSYYAIRFEPRGKFDFDFLNAFSEGHINNTVKVVSPSGQGVMVIPWDTMLGRRNTLTVMSGFSYRYDAVPIGRNAQLRFAMSMIYPSRESARAIVRINEERGGASRVLYSRDLTPPRAGEKLRFEFISVPLADFAGKNISVTFSVETPPGKDSSGHWVGFVAPRIVFDAGH